MYVSSGGKICHNHTGTASTSPTLLILIQCTYNPHNTIIIPPLTSIQLEVNASQEDPFNALSMCIVSCRLVE